MLPHANAQTFGPEWFDQVRDIVRRIARPEKRRGISHTIDHLDDIVQEVALRAWKSWPTARKPESFLAVLTYNYLKDRRDYYACAKRRG